jgi:osmotically-inducible protein OsmY
MKTIPIAAFAAATLVLAACDRANGDTTVGQKLDHAVQRTEQSLATAGEKTRETLRENAPKVERELSAAGRKIEDAGQKTIDTTKQAVQAHTGDHAATDASGNDTARRTAGDNTASGDARSANTRMDDLRITASVKADLVKDPDLSALKIDVDTKDGVVTLNGLANDEAAKQRAEKMAAAVKGVREVHNYLTIKRG